MDYCQSGRKQSRSITLKALGFQPNSIQFRDLGPGTVIVATGRSAGDRITVTLVGAAFTPLPVGRLRYTNGLCEWPGSLHNRCPARLALPAAPAFFDKRLLKMGTD